MATEWLTDQPPLSSLSDDFLLTVLEVASYLRVDEGTLESWRRNARLEGPPYVRLGTGKRSPVRYRVADLRGWLKANRHDPTESGGSPARVA